MTRLLVRVLRDQELRHGERNDAEIAASGVSRQHGVGSRMRPSVSSSQYAGPPSGRRGFQTPASTCERPAEAGPQSR